ncbi:MAG: hypothetical protein ABW352_16645 [Polyangiales bacterium]
MAVIKTSSRWKQFLAASVSVLALACGGDDGKDSEDGNGNQPPATGVVLGNGIVGKECAVDGDCGAGGSCKKTQSLGGLSDLLSAIGFDTSLTAPGGYCSIACTNSANCGQGGVCVGAIGGIVMGECRKSCAAATDCRSGYECAKVQATADAGTAGAGLLGQLPAQCQALPPTQTLGPDQAGKACSDAADAGVALNAACDPGFCALGSCSATCVNDSTCGANSVCVPNGIYGTTGSCQETCNADADCNQFSPTGSVGCVEANGRKLCTLKQYPLDTGVLGKACEASSECGRGATCATTLGGGFLNPTPAPGGYCTLNGCQNDSVCTGGVCVGNGAGARCYDSCSVDGECRTGYSCQDRVTSGMATSKVCAPVVGAAGDAGTAALVVGGLDGGV